MDPKNNYKNYRAAIKSGKSPILPYVGMHLITRKNVFILSNPFQSEGIYLRDLTFVSENANFIGNKDDGVLNIEKLELLGSIILEVRTFQQQQRYSFARNEVLQEYLKKLLTLPEEMLFKHSLLCEPERKSNNN